MMNLNDFRTLYRNNDWANDRLLAMLALAFEQSVNLRQADSAEVRAIQAAAVHLVAAQHIWRERWEGESPAQMLDPAEYPTVDAIAAQYRAERERFWSFFATIEVEGDLLKVIHARSTLGEPRSYPLWQMMLHVITHSMYHRGQIVARLLDIGKEDIVESTDLIAFFHLDQPTRPLPA